MRFAVGLLTVALVACSAGGDGIAEPATSSTTVLHGLGLEDRTGLVVEWEYAEDVDSWSDVPDDFEWGIRQQNPQSIEVGWWGLGCDDDPRLVVDTSVLELTLDGYLGDRPDPEVGCAMMGIWREVRLTFTENVDAEAFTLTVIEPMS